MRWCLSSCRAFLGCRMENKRKTADVSVVIPAYNSAGTISRALASVMAQTSLPQEVLVVDDGSNDDTVEIVKKWPIQPDQPQIQIICHSFNQGPAIARNAGWEHASSTYIAFLDADDAWHPRKLEIQFGWMMNHSEIGLSGHSCPELRANTLPEVRVERTNVKKLDPLRFLLSNQFSTPTAMIKRALPYRFRPGKHFAEDYLLWLQVVLDRVPVAYIDLPLAAIYKSAYGMSGLSARIWKMECGELATYWQLHREGRLGSLGAVLFSMTSLAKFLRRLSRTIFKSISRDRDTHDT